MESVTILKDAAATALLGHEGVNGAILVKTKRGVEGKTRVKVGYSNKFQFNPEFADMVDGYGYASAFNRARQNDGLSAAYTQQELDLFKSGSDPYFYPNVNWRDVSDVFALIRQRIPQANRYDDVVVVEPWDDDGIKISYDKKYEKGDER